MSSHPQQQLAMMLRLLNGHCIEQGLHVVATLGIADLLRDGAKTSKQLADATGVDAAALHRLLRMLAATDVFDEGENGEFALTELGATLRSDVVNSARDRAIFYGASDMWAVWGQLMHSVQTGASAFEQTHKQGFYEYLSGHLDVGAPFNRYMTKSSEQHIAPLLGAYDFTQFRSLVDVGGGQGGTLAAIMLACPKLRGVLYDLPKVVEGAKAFEVAGIAERVIRIGGDMHQNVPSGNDGYLIKWVLMDRSDEDAVQVLRNCRKAMAENGKVIVVEMLLPKRKPPINAALLDVQMMLLSGKACLRSEDEFRKVFELAGLRLAQVLPTDSPNTILEGVCA